MKALQVLPKLLGQFEHTTFIPILFIPIFVYSNFYCLFLFCGSCNMVGNAIQLRYLLFFYSYKIAGAWVHLAGDSGALAAGSGQRGRDGLRGRGQVHPPAAARSVRCIRRARYRRHQLDAPVHIRSGQHENRSSEYRTVYTVSLYKFSTLVCAGSHMQSPLFDLDLISFSPTTPQ